MEEIVKELARHLRPEQVMTGACASRIRRAGIAYRVLLESGHSLDADAVILATPSFAAAHLAADVAPELASVLAQIEYTSTATISLAYPISQIPVPLDG